MIQRGILNAAVKPHTYRHEAKYCTYFHVNPVTKEVFYVGIGAKKRPNERKSRSNYWKNYVALHGFEVQIIHENQTKEEAISKEIEYIKEFGRKDKGAGSLINLTDGGEGAFGVICSKPKKPISEKTRQKIKANNAKYWLGKKRSEETGRKISEAKRGRKGKPLSDEHKEKIRQRNSGKKHTEEALQKIREARARQVSPTKGKKCNQEEKDRLGQLAKDFWQKNPNHKPGLGKKWSDEHRQKFCEAAKGHAVTEETRKKIGAVHKGKIISEETRKKISENLKAYFENKKQALAS